MGALKHFNLKDILEKYKPRIAIELGTGYGTGVYELMRSDCFNAIFSVEINKEQVELLNQVFRFDTRVRIFNDTTINFLNSFLPICYIENPIFIFSDAHFPNADFGLADWDECKDENLRMPLIQELEAIKNLRTNRGAKDIILIDDISLYDESDRKYEDDHKKKSFADKLMPKLHRNYLPKIMEDFKNTHNCSVLTQEQGYLLMEPK